MNSNYGSFPPRLLSLTPVRIEPTDMCCISWNTAVQRLCAAGTDRLDKFLAAHSAAHNGLMSPDFEAALTNGAAVEGQACAALISIAASAGAAVYALEVGSELAYRVLPEVFQGRFLLAANPILLATSGILALVDSVVANRSLEAAHSGAPLIVERSAITCAHRGKVTTRSD